MTEYTGFHGVLTLDPAGGGAVAVTVLAEFSVKVGRSEATHPRSGEESDISVPGKLSASGTIQRIQDDGELLAHVMSGVLFDLVGTLTSTDAVPVVMTVTVTDAYMTSGEFKFTHAGEVSSDNATFAVKDVSATNPAIT